MTGQNKSKDQKRLNTSVEQYPVVRKYKSSSTTWKRNISTINIVVDMRKREEGNLQNLYCSVGLLILFRSSVKQIKS